MNHYVDHVIVCIKILHTVDLHTILINIKIIIMVPEYVVLAVFQRVKLREVQRGGPNEWAFKEDNRFPCMFFAQILDVLENFQQECFICLAEV